MKINKKNKNTMAMIAATLVLTGCSTSVSPQPDISNDVPDRLFNQEVQFPLSIKPVNHNPPPDDPIGLVEFALFLSQEQDKHESAGLIFMKAADIPSAGDQLAVDAYTAAAFEFINAAKRDEFLDAGEKLAEVVSKLEFRIISSETEQILNLYSYFLF